MSDKTTATIEKCQNGYLVTASDSTNERSAEYVSSKHVFISLDEALQFVKSLLG
jgi:hypothetical protein